MEKITQVNVEVQNVPGTLASVGEKLASAGISIIGLCCTEDDGNATWHFVVDDANKAVQVLADFKVTTSSALAYNCAKDEPGVVAKIARACSNAGINIKNMYTSVVSNNYPARVVLLVDENNIDEAAAVLMNV